MCGSWFMPVGWSHLPKWCEQNLGKVSPQGHRDAFARRGYYAGLENITDLCRKKEGRNIPDRGPEDKDNQWCFEGMRKNSGCDILYLIIQVCSVRLGGQVSEARSQRQVPAFDLNLKGSGKPLQGLKKGNEESNCPHIWWVKSREKWGERRKHCFSFLSF